MSLPFLHTGPFQILQQLEHQFLWLRRHSKDMPPLEAGSAVSTKAQALVAAIETFRDRINGNIRFVKFKTLVGFDSVFPLEWDGDAMDIEGPQVYRSARITEYVASITSENEQEWYEIVGLCAGVKSDDMATFPSFGEFLKQLAARSPAIVIDWLKKDEQLLSNFLPVILDGLGQSSQQGEGFSLISGWIEQGQHLSAIARYLRFAGDTPEEFVVKTANQAIALKDAIAAIEILAAVIWRQLHTLVQSVFVPAMRLLTELNDARWVNVTWFMPPLRPFIESLSEQERQVIVDNLIHRTRIDHHDEKVLQLIAQKHPGIVWTFFRNRMDRDKTTASGDRYEAVPYHMTELSKALARDARLAVDVARSWYSPDDHLFSYSGGRLLHNVFPQFTEEFEAELIRLVRSGAAGDIDFVLSVLGSYQGGAFLHSVCKELIDALPEDDKRIGQVEIILQSTGGVSGQFGMVQAYQGKKQEMEDWLTDARPKVRNFAEKYRRSLDRGIAAEQRRSESDYELRRREWPEEEEPE